MTATTEAPAFTLADVKKGLTALLLELAALVEPDTYECTDCAKSVEDRCGDHANDAAAQARLERAAALVRDAESRDDICAAIIYAAPDDAERRIVADLIGLTTSGSAL
jgi:hypothetical protein